jgi:hypothetical protein
MTTTDETKSLSKGDLMPLGVVNASYDIAKPKATLQLQLYQKPVETLAFALNNDKFVIPTQLIEQIRILEIELADCDKKVRDHMRKIFGVGRARAGKHKLLVDVEANKLQPSMVRGPQQYLTASYDTGRDGEPTDPNTAVDAILSQYIMELNTIVALCQAYTPDTIKQSAHVWKIYK